MKPQPSATVTRNVEHSIDYSDQSTLVGDAVPVVSCTVVDIPAPSPVLTTDHILVAHEVRSTAQGGIGRLGVFATEDVAAGTMCMVFGGYVTPGEVFRQLPDERQHHSFQIGDDLFMACHEELNDGDLVNHSCDPTLWFIGEITLLAMRDIAEGEQLTFDYATCDSQPYDEFECECGSPNCRVKVTGEDWMRRDLQDRYRGHFSPYLQRRIDTLPR